MHHPYPQQVFYNAPQQQQFSPDFSHHQARGVNMFSPMLPSTPVNQFVAINRNGMVQEQQIAGAGYEMMGSEPLNHRQQFLRQQ